MKLRKELLEFKYQDKEIYAMPAEEGYTFLRYKDETLNNNDEALEYLEDLNNDINNLIKMFLTQEKK